MEPSLGKDASHCGATGTKCDGVSIQQLLFRSNRVLVTIWFPSLARLHAARYSEKTSDNDRAGKQLFFKRASITSFRSL